jgi:hypothetical protein
LEERIGRKARGREYKKFLIHWKGQNLEDTTWILEYELGIVGNPSHDLLVSTP